MFRKAVCLSLLLCCALAPEVFAKPSARRTARAAADLQRTVGRWVVTADQYGYPNTERLLEDIEQLGGDVESAARRYDLFAAQEAVNEIVDVVIELRTFVRNIPSASHRAGIRRDLSRVVNALGQEVFEGDWIRVYAASTPTTDGSAPQAVDELQSIAKPRTPKNPTGFEMDNGPADREPIRPSGGGGSGGFDR